MLARSVLARAAPPRSFGAAVLSFGWLRELKLKRSGSSAIARQTEDDCLVGGTCRSQNDMAHAGGSAGGVVSTGGRHGELARRFRCSGVAGFAGESHDRFACAGESHGQSGTSMSFRGGPGGSARARESQCGFVCAGGLHGELTRIRAGSGVVEEDSPMIGGPHLANDACVAFVFDKKDAFRCASSSLPEEPLGHPDRPLSLFISFSFKNELILLLGIVLRLSFGYFRNVRNGNW